jgi:molybdopterin synthase catalytic subunit
MIDRMSIVRLTAVRDTPLSVDEVLAAVADPSAGGTALFVGTVRDHADGRAVTGLDYSAHPTAERVLRDVADGVAAAHAVTALAATHRTGDLKVGDVAVVVAAASPHRAEAFAACRAFIDELKERVPIWKRETLDSGDHVWVGM